jgi:uncharacterized protein YndB with AHSA1/START domain
MTVNAPELVMTLDRRIETSPADAFADWTVPTRLQWYLNPSHASSATVPITVDLTVGGAWCVPMVIDSDTAYMTGGVYREIIPGRLLRFVWGARPGWPDPSEEREGLVTLNDDDGATALHFALTWIPRAGDDTSNWPQCVAGWTDTIGRLVARYES